MEGEFFLLLFLTGIMQVSRAEVPPTACLNASNWTSERVRGREARIISHLDAPRYMLMSFPPRR